MKQAIKGAIKQAAPGLVQAVQRLKRLEEKVDALQAQITEQEARYEKHDFRIDHLKALSKEVEPYQPTYGFTGIFDDPARDSLDRARIIESHLGNPANLRVLDIGSSIGYMCYYFADRGAQAEGWDFRPKNAEVSRLVGEINGIDITVKTKQFDLETVKTIQPGSKDVVFILSVIHHILYYNDLAYTQKLMKELMERVPVLVVELARKGEDKKLFWDAAQPEDELAIFDLIKDDITIEKIADIGNHLSKHTRPLYIIRAKKQVTVNNHVYRYNHRVNAAYEKSPMVYSPLVRRYYFADKNIIKEYDFAKDTDNVNRKQIVAEINALLQLEGVHGLPKMTEFELTATGAKVVLERVPGNLLSEKLTDSYSAAVQVGIAKDILKTLRDLRTAGLNHNDVRSWNVIFDGKKATLIDYGLVAPTQTDDDVVSLLWVLHAMSQGEREGFEMFKDVPPATAFKGSEKLEALYKKVKAGERDPAKLLETLS